MSVVVKHDSCQIFHEENGLILTTQMYNNIMYVIYALVIMPMCFHTTRQMESQLWHIRYAQLSIRGLDTLVKKMVRGLLSMVNLEETCPDCLIGKQTHVPFLNKLFGGLVQN